MTSNDRAGHLDIARALIGLDFPASRDDVLDHVRSHGAQPNIVAALQRLGDQPYLNAQVVADRAVADGAGRDD